MIYVTGGTGLLGSHLLVELTKEQSSIRATYRSEEKRIQTRQLFKFYYPEDWETKFAQIEWVKGDILDVPFLLESMQDCEYIYHCAALVSFHKNDFNRLIKINREGTANIVNACLELNVKKLCYVSSTAAIGSSTNSSDDLISEKTKWKNTPTTSGYSISKYNAEREVWRGIEEGLNAIMVNPCVILGAGNWNDSSLTIFRTLEKGLKFYPLGSNATVDARDVSTVMIALMKSDIHSDRFLCIGSNQSFYDLMSEIAKQLNVKSPTIKTGRFIVEIARRLSWFFSLFSSKKPSITKETVQSLFGNSFYDNTKIKKAIGYEFKPLNETIENAIKGRIS
ncbi:MAG: NAD-dependent epimerase/dehydratase family protein [Crocinitomicaceae bacterium]|nr:NAD-dependent epimerase/dehydratase family protein [Crocinitomicaceae bacterium]MDP5098821.1 NAD-dependent epimerase/dehydratase family protein [Crocinitomicaceae bacterium]